MARTALASAETVLATLLAWVAARTWRRVLVTAALALAILIPGTASLPVTDRDEGRFVQASKQMLESGDLIDIRFQDRPRWKKPVGIYWLQAAAALPFGATEAPIWAYRLPSLLGVVMAAVLLGWAVRPLVGAEAATLAGLMLPATVLAAGEANIAKTDAALLATGVAILGAVARLVTEAPRPSLTLALALWTALAAAILIKGPIVPAIAILALVTLWILTRRAPPLSRLRPLPGLALTVALVAPWLVAIWQVSDGAFFAESVGRDLLGKVAEGQEKHWGPPGLYLALVWLTLWPWAALLVTAAPWLWTERHRLMVIALAAWVIPFWLVLEAVPTKLPHYVLPLYPALLALIAAWALAPERPPPSRTLRIVAAWLVALPGALLLVAMLVLPLVLEARLPLALLLIAPIAAAALALAALAARHGKALPQIGASLIAAGALYTGVLGHALPALDTAFPSARAAALAQPWQACADGPLISAGYREPSLVFHTATRTHLATPEEAARALTERPGALVLLEDRWRPLLAEHWQSPPTLIERARLTYFNYNRGKTETARLVTSTDPRWGPCED
ncbi:MAG: glycosyltransferase family 39 protein [Pseudomonadota bacterium]